MSDIMKLTYFCPEPLAKGGKLPLDKSTKTLRDSPFVPDGCFRLTHGNELLDFWKSETPGTSEPERMFQHKYTCQVDIYKGVAVIDCMLDMECFLEEFSYEDSEGTTLVRWEEVRKKYPYGIYVNPPNIMPRFPIVYDGVEDERYMRIRKSYRFADLDVRHLILWNTVCVLKWRRTMNWKNR